MTEFRLVIPVLNQRVVGLVGPPWQLSPDSAIETILDEDHAAILRDPPKGGGLGILITSKVFNIRVGGVKPTHDEVLRIAATSQFCLNYFAIEPGLAMSWGCIMAPGRRNQMSVVDYFDLSMAPIASAATHRAFKFDKDIKRVSLSGMHTASTQALSKFPGAMMAMDRFCRALSRDDKHDRLVDLCISLESLLDGNNELRFRFSQLHAMIGESNLDRRIEIFKLFTDFYDARSKVVHGDPNAGGKVAAIELRWPELLGYARKSLAYYLAFLSDNNREEWNQHVKKICLGIERPNVGE